MTTFRRNLILMLPVALLSVSLFLPDGLEADPKTDAADTEQSELQAKELGATRNVHQFGPTVLCGQPDKAALEQAKAEGIEVVINLRKKSETNWDESQIVEDLGIDYHDLGFQRPDSLTDEILDKSRDLLKKSAEAPVMLHCASANRVGAVWMAHRVLDDGLAPEAALKEAQQVGLRTPTYAAVVFDYIKRKQADMKDMDVGE